jgi:hypothetical protein
MKNTAEIKAAIKAFRIEAQEYGATIKADRFGWIAVTNKYGRRFSIAPADLAEMGEYGRTHYLAKIA